MFTALKSTLIISVRASAMCWIDGQLGCSARIERLRDRRWCHSYGKWSLLLSWAPIIGDPLTVIAGILWEPPPDHSRARQLRQGWTLSGTDGSDRERGAMMGWLLGLGAAALASVSNLKSFRHAPMPTQLIQ